MDPKLQAAFTGMNADPQFIGLNYEDQLAARSGVAAKMLAQDPEYAKLPDDQKQQVISGVAMQPPALADKRLEAQVNSTVARAKAGDPNAVQNVTGLAGLNAAGRSSVIMSLTAAGSGARPTSPLSPPGAASIIASGPGVLSQAVRGLNANPQSQVVQTQVGMPAPQQKSLMVGDDASKLQVYFGKLGQADPRFSGVAGGRKVGSLVGNLVDSIPFLLIPGGAAERAVAKGVQTMALGSRLGMNLGKLVLPAAAFAAEGAIGQVAQRNALAYVQKAPELYTDTVAKIASVAEQGAAVNFLFSVGVRGAAEFAGPAIRFFFKKPVMPTELSSTGALWWKRAADPVEIDKAIAASGGTGSVPQENILSLHPYVRDSAWLRSFSMEAASRDASTMDLRPMDQLALASNDMPDVIFAPKDWSNPTGSGFNLWEMKRGATGGHKVEYLMTGEAADLGDLRSKLADMASSRWSAIEDTAKPSSMQGSQVVVRQGVMQQANAKAYDPFPETVAKGFTRPSLRGYLTPTEAQDAASASLANGGTALHVKVDLTPDEVRRISANKGFLTDSAPIRVTPTDPSEANALAIITKPADAQSIAQAQAFADRAVKENAGWTSDEARKFFLVQKGFDGIADPANGRYEVFFPSRMKWITPQVSESGKLLPKVTSARLAELGPLGGKIAIQSRIEATIGKETLAANPSTLAQIATAKFKGTLPAPDVQGFIAQIAGARGIENTGVRVVKAAGTSDRLSADAITSVQKLPNGTIQVTIPDRIVSVDGQRSFVNDLLGKIGDLGPKASTPFETLRSKAVEAMAKASPSRFSLPFGDEEAGRQWLSSIAQSEFGGSTIATLRGGGYGLLDASGKLQETYGSLQEMGDSMLLSSLDDRFVRGDLYRQGYTLRGSKGGVYTLSGPGLSSPVKSNNLQQLLGTIDYRPASISNRLAPQDVQIAASSTRVTFDGKTMFASGRKVRQVMSGFENPDELASMAKINHTSAGDVYQVAPNSFRVDIPALKSTRYFTSAKDAQAFLSTDFKQMMALKDIANSKGLSLHYDYATGGFVLGDGKSTFRAPTAEDAHKVFAAYPDMPGAREILTGLDPQADEAVKQAIAKVDPAMMSQWKTGAFDRSLVRWDAGSLDSEPLPGPQGITPGVRSAIRDFSSSYDRYTEATIGRELGLRDLAGNRRALKRGADAAYTASTQDKRILYAIFTGENGRLMPLARRQAIVAYKEASGVPEALPRAQATFGALSAHEQMRLSQFQNLTDNLFHRFGVDPSTYIKGYVSHIRDWTLRNWSEASNITSADELLSKAYNGMGNVPAKLAAMFHNERGETLLDATMEDDPLKIFSHYVDQGNKEMFLKAPMQDTLDYLKANAKNIPGPVMTHMLTDMQALGGYHEIQGMARAQAFIASVHDEMRKIPVIGKFIKPSDAATGAKLFQNFMSLSYVGKIGFRPWIAARNMLQPYQLLAPRIGIGPVLDATKKVLSDDGSLMLRLRSEGTLMKAPPIPVDIGEGPLAKLANRSMQRVWTSDDYTRAVAAVAGETMLDDGIRSWGKGVFKGDVQAFKNFTELRSIQGTSPELADQVAQLAISGDPVKVAQAKQLFGKQLASETAPEYSTYARPHVFTNTLPGYLFGRFSTYSVAYREAIYRGWQNGAGVAGKALFAGRFVGINLGIYAALQKVGINGKDFIPGYSGMFGGSPQFSTALAAVQAFAPGTTGIQARKTLEQAISPVVVNEKTGAAAPNYPTILPGSMQAYYGKQMLDAYSKGDYWKMFLAATTTPALK